MNKYYGSQLLKVVITVVLTNQYSTKSVSLGAIIIIVVVIIFLIIIIIIIIIVVVIVVVVIIINNLFNIINDSNVLIFISLWPITILGKTLVSTAQQT